MKLHPVNEEYTIFYLGWVCPGCGAEMESHFDDRVERLHCQRCPYLLNVKRLWLRHTPRGEAARN